MGRRVNELIMPFTEIFRSGMFGYLLLRSSGSWEVSWLSDIVASVHVKADWKWLFSKLAFFPLSVNICPFSLSGVLL